jgi:nicotinate-nucleotide--dimethylbenzimidazole phosphoribosyltransferase
VDFSTIGAALDALAGPDQAAIDSAHAHEAQLTKPAGSLARLEDLAAWVTGWQGRHPPSADHIQALVFAGNHGIAARGVSAFPAEVTFQMVANFQAGGAAINQLCRSVGADLTVHPIELERPTADFTVEPAMTESECDAAFELGRDQVDDAAGLVCLGEMGIGNTTAAAALACALFGGDPADWVGRGTGVDDAGLARKTETVAAGLACHADALADPLEALRRLGGRELAAIAGAVMGAREKRVPVLLDGFICCAAAAVLHAARPGALDHCVAAHRSAEPGHDRLLTALAMTPLLDLGLRLGEASGAALAAHIVKAAIATHAGMATFAEAGVSEKSSEP